MTGLDVMQGGIYVVWEYGLNELSSVHVHSTGYREGSIICVGRGGMNRSRSACILSAEFANSTGVQIGCAAVLLDVE